LFIPFCKKKRLISILVTLCIVFGTFAIIDSAQNQATVTVENVTGLVNETVDVSINLNDFTNLGIGGISGGQFQLSYDSNLVQLVDMIPGDFHTWQWTVEFNPALTDNSLAYAWISSQQFHQDARIVTFKFKLLQAGTANLQLNNLILKDDSMPSPLSIPSEAINVVDGSTTATIPLEQVAKPLLSDLGVVSWVTVNNASFYEITLYKGDSVVDTQSVVGNIEQYNMLPSMRTAGVGEYSVTVKALGTVLYSDGPVSDSSDPRTVVALATVGQPEFSQTRFVTWTDVINASSYEAQLYKDGVDLVAMKSATSGIAGVSFYGEMRDAGIGDYNVKVRAVGTGLYLEGELSEASVLQTVSPIVLTVSNEQGIVTFNKTATISIADATYLTGGQFILSYDSNIIEPVSVAPGGLLGDIGEGFIINLNHPQGIFIAWAGATQVIETEGIFCTLEFLVKAEGDTALVVSGLELFDEEGALIPSTAENGTFTAIDVVFGDVNEDGVVDVGDAILVLRSIVGLTTLNARQIKAADVNGDGVVDVGDAILILRRIVGLVTKFPVEP